MSTLTTSQVKSFEREGYLLVHNLLNPEKILDPLVNEYELVLDRLATSLYNKGEISSLFKGLNFSDRMIEIVRESRSCHAQYFDMHLPIKDCKPDTPFWTGPAVFNVLTADDLLDAVESLIGYEIYSNPIQHVRIKPPEKFVPKNKYGEPILGRTIWHQDHGVTTEEADETQMLTVWMSLQDATVEKGPLLVVPRSHKTRLLTHCPNYFGNGVATAGQTQIPEQLFDVGNSLPLPTKRGDVIFMHKQTVHGSLPNLSDEVRWSLDLRYNPIGQATGRSIFPGFVARSRANPESILRDSEEWNNTWLATRENMSVINQGEEVEFRRTRWDGGQLECA